MTDLGSKPWIQRPHGERHGVQAVRADLWTVQRHCGAWRSRWRRVWRRVGVSVMSGGPRADPREFSQYGTRRAVLCSERVIVRLYVKRPPGEPEQLT